MSGVAAIIHFDGRPVEKAQIAAMTSLMAHRGPDGIGHWTAGSVAMGQCTLHTTAQSIEATLPLCDDSGDVVLILDGRIDNYHDLHSLLSERGARLRSGADAELVLHAYLLFDKNLGQHIEGDFALVIWDQRKRRAVCLRDPMGHKPFFYAWSGTTLTVASEVAPILKMPWVKATFNEGVVAEFLATEWYSREDTLWKGIHRLAEAHGLICGPDGPEVWEFWRPDPNVECPVSCERELPEYYRFLLTDSVRRLSRSHLPIACEVSGGLDSSAVFSLAKLLENSGNLPAPSVQGFTLRFEDDAAANDLPYARSVARHLGCEINEVDPTRMPMNWYAERVRKWRDFPGLPNGVMHLGILEQAAKSGSAVLLDGRGGDEWLHSSIRTGYMDAVSAKEFSALFASMSADVRDFGGRRVLAEFVRHGLVSNLPPWLKASARRGTRYLRAQRSADLNWMHPRLRALLEAGRCDGPNRLPKEYRRRGQLVIDACRTSPGRALAFRLEEQQAASVGIERRSPLDDRRIFELAHSLPAWMARRGAQSKLYHRRALRSLLPTDVLERKDKATFSKTYDPYIKEILERATSEKDFMCEDWLNPDVLPTHLRTLSGSVGDYRLTIWCLFWICRIGNLAGRDAGALSMKIRS